MQYFAIYNTLKKDNNYLLLFEDEKFSLPFTIELDDSQSENEDFDIDDESQSEDNY